jgi:hypothetical protein
MARMRRLPAVVRTELGETTGPSTDRGPLSMCTVTLEMAPRQRLTHEGIQLVVEISNRAAETIELINPLDFLVAGIVLADHTGQRLELPRVVPRLLIHTGGPDRNRLTLPFRVDFVDLAEHRLPESAIERRTMVLEPGVTLAIGMTVDRIVVRQRADRSVGHAEPVPIATGDYQIQVSVTLVQAGQPEVSRVVQSPPLPVTLSRLGRASPGERLGPR